MMTISDRFWAFILRWSPTCFLQWELSKREGVTSHVVHPYERRSFDVEGPAIVSVNID